MEPISAFEVFLIAFLVAQTIANIHINSKTKDTELRIIRRIEALHEAIELFNYGAIDEATELLVENGFQPNGGRSGRNS